MFFLVKKIHKWPVKNRTNKELQKKNSIIEEVIFSGIKQKEISLFIKREDLIHPFISGNKYRKLKYNILEAQAQEKNRLLTFGGAFSNHIAAVAAAGKKNNLQTIGVIRGEELANNFENTLETNSTLRLLTIVE